MKIDEGIFKAYDIRGIWQKSLFPETAYTIGRAMGTFFHNHKEDTVYVSHDNRVSSEPLSKEFIRGLLESGMDVVFMGLATTPMNYAAWYIYDANATVTLTASHNPAEYNGFKAAF